MNPRADPDPETKPRRRSLRLKGYDYSLAGGYFVTIVTQLRAPFFGKICNGEMLFSEAGRMVLHQWEILPERFPNIEIDVFQVMPNHFHAILLIHTPNPVGAGLVPAQNTPAAHNVGEGLVPSPGSTTRVRATTRVAPTLGEVIGAYKSITTHKYIRWVKERAWPVFNGKLWQRNYFEHILRDQVDYERIAGYIIENPANWDNDGENPLGHPHVGGELK